MKLKSLRGRRVVLTLPDPVQLGNYVIKARSYCVVTAELEDGTIGTSFSLDRGSPVTEAVNNLIAKPYIEIFSGDPLTARDILLRQASTSLSAGAALKAFSIW